MISASSPNWLVRCKSAPTCSSPFRRILAYGARTTSASDTIRRYELTRLAEVWQNLPVSVRFLSHFNTRLYPVVWAVRLWNRWRHTTTGRAETDNRRHSRLTNWLLTRVFVGEGSTLRRALRRGRKVPYARGVSLLAVLQIASVAVPQHRASHIVQQGRMDCS